MSDAATKWVIRYGAGFVGTVSFPEGDESAIVPFALATRYLVKETAERDARFWRGSILERECDISPEQIEHNTHRQ